MLGGVIFYTGGGLAEWAMLKKIMSGIHNEGKKAPLSATKDECPTEKVATKKCGVGGQRQHKVEGRGVRHKRARRGGVFKWIGETCFAVEKSQ